MNHRSFFLALLSSGCAGRNYTHYLVETAPVTNPALVEEQGTQLRPFGFGSTTGIGFPGEADGILMPVEDWWGTSMATIPIGQGIAVTPLQMASVCAATFWTTCAGY